MIDVSVCDLGFRVEGLGFRVEGLAPHRSGVKRVAF